MLKESVRIAEKNGILYPFAQNGRPLRQKPWLGDLFSPLYDRLMKRSVFPKKMEASYDKHYEILGKMLGHISGKAVIVMGRNANGLTEWKTKTGKTLKDVESNERVLTPKE